MAVRFTQILEHLRVCANCGRGTVIRTTPVDLYCESCWSDLFSLIDFRSSTDYSFKNFSLFSWSEDSSNVADLIYQLKAGRLDRAFSKLAEEFVFQLFKKTPVKLLDNVVLIVPPSNRKPHSDHAFAWGKALSEVVKAPLVAAFEFDTSLNQGSGSGFGGLIPQKFLPKRDRLKRQFKLNLQAPLSKGRYIFVDDLITTGGTALAAFEALKKPKHFEVWTIARRPKLASI